MKRRSFLKGLMAVPAAAVIPAVAKQQDSLIDTIITLGNELDKQVSAGPYARLPMTPWKAWYSEKLLNQYAVSTDNAIQPLAMKPVDPALVGSFEHMQEEVKEATGINQFFGKGMPELLAETQEQINREVRQLVEAPARTAKNELWSKTLLNQFYDNMVMTNA